MAVTQTDSIEDEFQQGLQEVGEMRDKYERLLAVVADAQERAAGALLGGPQPHRMLTSLAASPPPPSPLITACVPPPLAPSPSTLHAPPPYLSSRPSLSPLRASECAEALHQLAAVVADAFGGVEEGGAGDTLLAAAAVDGRLAEFLYFHMSCSTSILHLQQTLAEPAEALPGEMQHVVVRCSRNER
ncbi:unnamed protein product [Closterium sp. NIES-65]|nr:unnamed protein product [Closterium sp. NIES-65]